MRHSRASAAAPRHHRRAHRHAPAARTDTPPPRRRPTIAAHPLHNRRTMSASAADVPEPPSTASHLARNLVSLRHARNLTQDALGRAAAVPRSTIANLESGDGNPSLAVLGKGAGVLGVPIDGLPAPARAGVRRWAASEVASRSRGRGITIRDLVPEPVPDEMMELMDFEPGSVMGGTPHLPGTRE